MILCDVDNCISNDGWRQHFIDRVALTPDAAFHKYHLMSVYDAYKDPGFIDDASNVIFITAMPEKYRLLRQAWMFNFALKPFAIYMRPDDDHAHSVDIKRRLTQKVLDDHPNIPVTAAYDDRADVVAMWREDFGFPAEVRRIGEIPETIHWK